MELCTHRHTQEDFFHLVFFRACSLVLSNNTFALASAFAALLSIHIISVAVAVAVQHIYLFFHGFHSDFYTHVCTVLLLFSLSQVP